MGIDLKKLHILVVDDQQSMRKVMSHLLISLGYPKPDEAPDGKTAMMKLKNHEYDLVITDWNMPCMSGLELLRRIRAYDQTEFIPVLMVTTEGSRKQVLEAAAAGVNSYVTKPFSASTLQEKIDHIFKHL